MPSARLEDGCFVWTLFPFGPPHQPDQPGPVRHIGYVLGSNTRGQVLLAYTSSGPWRGSERRPPGVMEFDTTAARRLGQRAFHLDLRVLARLPITSAWFPDLRQPDAGVVGLASEAMIAEIDQALKSMLARSSHSVEIRGPR